MASRTRVSARIELHVVHAQWDGQLVPSKFTLKARYPFAVEYECPAWVATFVGRCDGESTALEHFEAGKRDNWIRSDMPLDEFARMLGELVSHGILEVADFKPPGQSNLASNG